MKLNKLFLLTLFPLLSSCQMVPEYDGLKVKIPYKENGGIVEYTPDGVYDYLITNSNSGLLYLSTEHCSACIEAHEQIDTYSKMMNFEVMEVKINKLNKENYDTLVSVTTYIDSLYALPEFGEELTLPCLYLFSSFGDGSGVVNTTTTNFVDFLRMYIEIVKN